MQPDPKISLVDYLRTTPAQVGNAALDDQRAELGGAAIAAGIPEKLQQKTANSGELGASERGWLKHLQNEPGYLTLFKVLNNIVLGFEKAATLQSQGDPLGNRDLVANAWAYATMGRQIQHRLIMTIDELIAQAKEDAP